MRPTSLLTCIPFLALAPACSGSKGDSLSESLGADAAVAHDSAAEVDADVFDSPEATTESPDADVTQLAPCVVPTGVGTTHGGSINDAETWTAADSPHILPYDTGIYAAVSVEACAVIRIAAGRTVTVRPGAAFVTHGETGRLVTIEAADVNAPWSSIRSLGGALSLTHTLVRGGGDPLSTNPAYAGAVQFQSDTSAPALHVDDVEIADSLSQGVYVHGDVGFDESSEDLRVHGSVGYPVHVYANLVGTLPAGDYTGNGQDAIAIAGSGGAIKDTQTLHQRGVPYHVGSGMDGGRLDVNSMLAGRVAVLTIEAGVTMQFPPGGTLNIDRSSEAAAQGALVAIGTADAPIVFTSDRAAASAAGDWLGLGFGGQVDARTTLQHVRVEYAGGAGTGDNSCPYPGRVGQNDAAIRIFGPPLTQFITNTEVRASARDGIDRGWRADIQPDFLPSNTFTDVAGCKQSTPRTANGVCPANPECP